MISVFTQTDDLYLNANRMNALPDTLEIGIVTTGAGTTTLQINNIPSLSNYHCYFEDKLLSAVMPINADNFTYQFAETGDQLGRFRIYADYIPSHNSEVKTGEAIAYIYNNQLNILSKNGNIQQVQIFDATGRLFVDKTNLNTDFWQYPTEALGKVLIVKTRTQNGLYINKVINLNK
jgi:hypothetical protein